MTIGRSAVTSAWAGHSAVLGAVIAALVPAAAGLVLAAGIVAARLPVGAERGGPS